MTLYDALKEYTASAAYPFHMPGHKRRAAFLCDPATIDITEIDGFDNLHHAEGILRDAEARASALYGSSETHFLVNGSTAGILSAIGACVARGGTLLMARNSHRSAYNAAALNRVKTLYLYPSRAVTGSSGGEASAGMVRDLNGPIDPQQVAGVLENNKDICAVFVTSPTYDGVVSDVGRIAEIAHRYGVPLIIDEAHGAHFGMHEIFPESSVKMGADLVIHSLHKTLPALTQTALIHVNGPLVDRGRLRRLLSVYQTSSPSYVLMASIDQCIHLLSEEGSGLFDAYTKRLEHFYRETKLKHFSFLHTDDPSRILIRPDCQMSAMQICQTLRVRFGLEPEMAAASYVLMLSSVCDDDEGFSRLSSALRSLDREYDAADSSDPELSPGMKSDAPEVCPSGPELSPGMKSDAPEVCPSGPGLSPEMKSDAPEVCCTIAHALDAKTDLVPFLSSEGRISAEYLMLYPPGVPLLVPGERIRPGILRDLLALKDAGYSVQGPEDRSLKQIRVLSSVKGAP